MKRLNYFVCAALAVAAAVGCNEKEGPQDFPVVGEITLCGESTNAATNSWYPGEKVGVFVTSDGVPQVNLLYTPSEVCEDKSTEANGAKYWMFGDPVGNVALNASSEKAGFKQGVHNVYAYSPYNPAATDLTAVPMPDLTKQDETIFMGQTINPALSFIYSSVEVKEYTTAPVDLGTFKSLNFDLNTGSIEFKGCPESVTELSLVKLIISSDKPLAYKNGTFNLVEEKINGESSEIEVITNQQIKFLPGQGFDMTTFESYDLYATNDPVKFAVVAPASTDDFKTMKFNFTGVLSDGSEYVGTDISPNVMNFGGTVLVTFGSNVVLTKK